MRLGTFEDKTEVPGVVVTCVAPGSPDGRLVYLVGDAPDRARAPLKLLDLAPEPPGEVVKLDADLAGAVFGRIAVGASGRMVLVGSSDPAALGVVRCYAVPAPGSGEFMSFQVRADAAAAVVVAAAAAAPAPAPPAAATATAAARWIPPPSTHAGARDCECEPPS